MGFLAFPNRPDSPPFALHSINQPMRNRTQLVENRGHDKDNELGKR